MWYSNENGDVNVSDLNFNPCRSLFFNANFDGSMQVPSVVESCLCLALSYGMDVPLQDAEMKVWRREYGVTRQPTDLIVRLIS